MTTSRVPAIIDALVSIFETALDIPVYDGPVVTQDYPPACATVGFDGDPEGDMRAATSTTEWAGLGAKKRNEPAEVTCSLVVVRGEVTNKQARDEVYGYLAQVDTALIADPSLGLASPLVARIASHQLYPMPVESGTTARIVFTVQVSINRI